jgi:putative two-component system response regulator
MTSTPSTILIVDDEPINIDLLRETLKSKYRLIIATRGEQAYSLAVSKKPDLILMDVMMPGMDGFETCEKIKENPETNHIPIVFVTALNEVEDKSVGYEMGGSDYITKPFEMSDVLTCIETHLNVIKLAKRVKELENNDSDYSQPNLLVQKLNELISSVSSNAQIVKLFWSSIEPIIKKHANEDLPSNIYEKLFGVGDIIDNIISDTREMTSLINKTGSV